MLEFSGGNEIAYLLGVFMRSKVFFFRSLRYQINTSKTGKGCDKFYGVLNFLHLLRDKSKKDCGGSRDTQTAMWSLLCYYTFAELPMRSVRSCARTCVYVRIKWQCKATPVFCMLTTDRHISLSLSLSHIKCRFVSNAF